MYKTFTMEMMVHCLRQGTALEEVLAQRAGLLTEAAQRGTSSGDDVRCLTEYRKSLARFRLCVEALPEKEQQALRETYGTGDKVAVAADRLQISRNTLSKYRKRGLERLMELYHSELTEWELREMGVQSLLGIESEGKEDDRLSDFKGTIKDSDRG